MKLNQSIELVRLIKKAGDLYDKMIARCAETCGVSKQEADVLVFLANNPENGTAREVAQMRGCSKAYVSKAVDRLMARGYIRATTDEQDRRMQRLQITGLAHATVQAIQNAQCDFAAYLTKGITAQEKTVCMQAIQKIAENMEQIKQAGIYD